MYQGWAESPQESGRNGTLYGEAWVTKSQLAPDLIENRAGILFVSESNILKIARNRLAGKFLLRLALRQAWSEFRVRFLNQNNFRVTRNGDACRAYCAMDVADFQGINARQWWANWRTIPRNISGILPDQPLQVLDLCCGIGQSTEVLAFYAAPGSEILGLEYNPDFVRQARTRQYFDRHGRRARARFVPQSVLETFRDTFGQPLPAASIDWVNASGAVGCHFDADATRQLVRETTRVVKPGGLATIDTLRRDQRELTALMQAHGFRAERRARSCAIDRFSQVCFRRE